MIQIQKSVEAELGALRIEAAECRSIMTLREKELQQMRQLAGVWLSVLVHHFTIYSLHISFMLTSIIVFNDN